MSRPCVDEQPELVGGDTIAHGEAVVHRVFTGMGEDETSPDRVAFWDIALTTAGLTLGRAHDPEPQTAHATWSELHALLGAKDALVADIAFLVEERDAIQRELIALRGWRRRYTHQLATMKAEVEAARVKADADAAGRADGSIVPLPARSAVVDHAPARSPA